MLSLAQSYKAICTHCSLAYFYSCLTGRTVSYQIFIHLTDNYTNFVFLLCHPLNGFYQFHRYSPMELSTFKMIFLIKLIVRAGGCDPEASLSYVAIGLGSREFLLLDLFFHFLCVYPPLCICILPPLTPYWSQQMAAP